MMVQAMDLPLVCNDKLVFLTLCENADEITRTSTASYITITKRASVTNSTLKTALKVLESVGLISIKIQANKDGERGGREDTLYEILSFDVEMFDGNNYKKIAKEIRTIFRENH